MKGGNLDLPTGESFPPSEVASLEAEIRVGPIASRTRIASSDTDLQPHHQMRHMAMHSIPRPLSAIEDPQARRLHRSGPTNQLMEPSTFPEVCSTIFPRQMVASGSMIIKTSRPPPPTRSPISLSCQSRPHHLSNHGSTKRHSLLKLK